MIKERFYPMPNDMTTLYNSKKIFSRLFFKSPRLFVVIWSIIEAIWGGTFSVFSLSIFYIFRNRVLAILTVLLVYISNYFLSIYFSVTPWKCLLYAGAFGISSLKIILLNNLSIIFFSIAIFILFQNRKSDKYKKNN